MTTMLSKISQYMCLILYLPVKPLHSFVRVLESNHWIYTGLITYPLMISFKVPATQHSLSLVTHNSSD